MSETRTTVRGEVRAVDDDGTVTVTAVAYGVVDDYGSLWLPGVFTRSLAERLPTFAWAHSWDEPIGRAIDHQDTEEAQVVTLRLDLDEDVPRARQAHAQMKSGTLDDVSVGFSNVTRRPPTDEERKQYPGVTEVIEDADLDEISVVLRGAVPGAKVLSVRDARGAAVDLDAVVEVAKRKVAGEITQAEADEALRLLGDPAAEVVEPEVVVDTATADEVLAEVDVALEGLADRSR